MPANWYLSPAPQDQSFSTLATLFIAVFVACCFCASASWVWRSMFCLVASSSELKTSIFLDLSVCNLVCRFLRAESLAKSLNCSNVSCLLTDLSFFQSRSRFSSIVKNSPCELFNSCWRSSKFLQSCNFFLFFTRVIFFHSMYGGVSQ